MPFACIWRSPFTSVQVLQQLVPGWDTAVRAITPDGATAVGAAMDDTGRWRAVKWNTTTLAITLLADPNPTEDCAAYATSSDASVIVGGWLYTGGNPQTNRRLPVGSLTRLMGSSGSPLPDGVGGTNTSNQTEYATRGPVLPRCISDDGSVIIGFADNTTFTATKWIDGTRIALPPPGYIGSNPADAGPIANGCSRDGSVVIGGVGYHVGDAFSDGGYWTGTTLRRLTTPSVASTSAMPNVAPTICNDDCSIVWGWTSNTDTTSGGGNSAVYWDNVGTLQGDGIHYGTPHVLPDLASSSDTGNQSVVNWAASDPGVAIAIGQSISPSNVPHAVKWTGTSIADLGVIGSDTYAESYAYGCNHNASIVCGASLTTYLGVLWPVRWDAGNTLHVLPTLADPSDGFQGEAWGVSRDGSVIFGLINVGDVPPSASLAMDNLLVSGGPKTSELIFLEWSDDRGHTFGNPVGQKIGERGAYLTSVNWNRLGYARDRVFRLTWSVPVKTALQGAWIDPDTRAKS